MRPGSPLGLAVLGSHVAAAAADTIPDAFSFTDQTDVDLDTLTESDAITVAGLGSGVVTSVYVAGGEYSKNGGAYTTAAGTAVNDDQFTVRHTSSSENETATNTVLTIGGVSDTFTTTTVAEAEVLGNELWAQPEFDATTGLTLNGWSVSGGQANSNAQLGFLTCTAAETLDTGDYRIDIDIASNPGTGDINVLIANGVSHLFSGTGIQTVRKTLAMVNDQTIRIRDQDEVGIVLNSISVKKVISG